MARVVCSQGSGPHPTRSGICTELGDRTSARPPQCPISSPTTETGFPESAASPSRCPRGEQPGACLRAEVLVHLHPAVGAMMAIDYDGY